VDYKSKGEWNMLEEYLDLEDLMPMRSPCSECNGRDCISLALHDEVKYAALQTAVVVFNL
jgi:hypothetical protein